MWHFAQSMWKVITKAGRCPRVIITLALTRKATDLGSRQPPRVRALVLCLVLRTSAPFTPVLVQSPVQRAQNKLHEHRSLLGLATITDSYSPNTDFGSCCSHGRKSAGRGPAAGAARSLFRLLSASSVSPQHPTQRGLWQTERSQASKESQEHQE